MDIESQVNDASQDASSVSIAQPVGQIFASCMCFRVAKHDGAFSGPEEASCDAACRRTKVYEPFSTVSIVRIQGC